MARPPTMFALAGILAGIYLLLFVMEQVRPLRGRRRPLQQRLGVNLLVSALALVAAFLLVRPVIQSLVGWSVERPFGLLRWLGLPPLLEAASAYLLFDLSFYWWHRANHRVPVLWRFHIAHHVDTDLDVTTSLRFHFGEIGLSAGFRAVQIAVLGPLPWIVVAYEATFQAATMFHHSNLRLPLPLERRLSGFMVTPRMHGVHHSHVRGETESNFSSVFSVWDRLHRTLRLNVPQNEIVIGIPGYAKPDDNVVSQVLRMPFRRQREAWRAPDGSVPQRDPALLTGPPTQLAS